MNSDNQNNITQVPNQVVNQNAINQTPQFPTISVANQKVQGIDENLTKNIASSPSENKPEKEKNGAKTFGLILLIMGLLLVGLGVYKTFLDTEKPQNNEPNPSDTENTDLILPATYITSDRVGELRIVDKNDSTSINNAKALDENFDEQTVQYDYFGYYNGKITLIDNNPENVSDSKYMIINAKMIGVVPNQCGYTHSYVINKDNSELMGFISSYDLDNGYIYKIKKIGEKIYFLEANCDTIFDEIGIYNENLVKLGNKILGSDSNNNFYLLKDGIITKYSPNEDILATNNEIYSASVNRYISYKNIITNDTIYLVASIDGMIYLVDGLTDEKYELGSENEYNFGERNDYATVNLSLDDNIITITLDAKIENAQAKNYTFNIIEKELLEKDD